MGALAPEDDHGRKRSSRYAYSNTTPDCQRSPEDIARITQLEQTVERMCLNQESDARLLRGLVKLVNMAHLHPDGEMLCISPIEMHADKDVSHVWRLIKEQHRADGQRGEHS